MVALLCSGLGDDAIKFRSCLVQFSDITIRISPILHALSSYMKDGSQPIMVTEIGERAKT